MPIDIAVLASTVVSSFLVPVAKKGLSKLREEIAEKADDAVSDGVETVWNKVKSLFTSERERGRWADLEESPEAAAPMVTATLEQKLKDDPEAVRELDEIVNRPVPGSGGGATLQHIMAETFGFVDARGAQVSGSAQMGGVIMNTERSREGLEAANGIRPRPRSDDPRNTEP